MLVILSAPDLEKVQFASQMEAKLFLTRKLGCLKKSKALFPNGWSTYSQAEENVTVSKVAHSADPLMVYLSSSQTVCARLIMYL